MKYKLTPEHEAQLPQWSNRWIANAMRATPLTQQEKQLVEKAIKGMYLVAGLEVPRVVFAPSPFVASFSAGLAAAIWYKRNATRAAIRTAIENVTWDATWYETKNVIEDETWNAVWNAITATPGDTTEDAVREAIRDATKGATEIATRIVTKDATWEAAWQLTWEAAWDAAWNATRVAVREATENVIKNAAWDATEAATRAAPRDVTEAVTRAAIRTATENVTWAATWDAAKDATVAATSTAIEDAIRDATETATWEATWEAAWNAAWAATWDTTKDATEEASEAATRNVASALDSWFYFPIDLFVLSQRLGLGDFGVECCKNIWNIRQFGKEASGFVSFMSFFRHIVKLPIDYTAWDHWEQASIASVRYVHEKFCIVSDNPIRLLVDDQNRPHCADGPFCQWADGSALYSWHGVRVPIWSIEQKHLITKESILAESNTEVRRAFCEIIGWEKALELLESTLIDSDECLGLPRQLLQVEIGGKGNIARLLVVKNGTLEPDGTRRQFVLGVPPEIQTCHQAVAWSYGLNIQKYKEGVRA